MALAIKFQDMVDRGEVRDYADLARLGYVSRARLTQIMNLLLLAPDIQEEILVMTGQPIPVSERHARPIARIALWGDQKCEWRRRKVLSLR
jgi:RNA polymerase-binding transcription factor DksA